MYAPRIPQEKEAEAARKLKKAFETLEANWNQISKIRTFYFVFNAETPNEETIATIG